MSMFNQIYNDIQHIIKKEELYIGVEGNWTDEKTNEFCFDLFSDSDFVEDDEFIEYVYCIAKKIAQKYYVAEITVYTNAEPNEFNSLFEGNLTITVR